MKNVLITGVSRGIGKALAQKFLKEGYFVLGTSTDGSTEWSDKNMRVFSLDLSKPESIKNCVSAITDLGKRIDILINNAGIWSGVEDDPIIHLDLLRKTLEVNLFGTVDFTEQTLSLVNEGGHIINITSRAGSLGYTYHANYPDYKISKVALNMVTRILALRLKDRITVSSVHPGWVKTDMGGEDADVTPEEAAVDIYKLAVSKPETGQFWYKGEKFEW